MEKDIRTLIDRYMAGQTSLEEESRLADYLRTHDVGEDLQPYKQMFAWFDEGMPLENRQVNKQTSRQAALQPSQSSQSSQFSRKTVCLIAAAAASIALLVLVAWPKAEPQQMAENTAMPHIQESNEPATTPDTLTADTATTVVPMKKARRRKPRIDRYKPLPPKTYIAETQTDSAIEAAEMIAEATVKVAELQQEAMLDSIYDEHKRIEAGIDLYVTAMENYDVEDEYY
ncbi:MAG TPA: hypothetical protein H9986_00095 [Candidatus Prevotella stercoripullorum]|nr:hypothetical protein [Candidatus Prevotella stercoripullorum]